MRAKLRLPDGLLIHPGAADMSGLARTEQDALAREALRHVAAISIVGAIPVFGGGLFDDLIGTDAIAWRLVAGLVVAGLASILGGWPVELLGRDRHLLRLRLVVFAVAILLVALHATLEIEALHAPPAGTRLLVMMFAAIPFAPFPEVAIPFALLAGYGAWRTLPQPGLVGWLLPAAIGSILVLASRFRSRMVLNVRLRDQGERLETLLADYEHGGSEVVWEAGRDGVLHMRARRHDADGGEATAVPSAIGWADLVRAGTRPDAPSRRDFLALREAIREERPFRDCVLPVPAKGAERWWAFAGRPVLDGAGKVRGYRGTASDVTERRATEARVRYLADHDGLTGLLNRPAFLASLGTAVKPGAAVALMLVNIDGFQSVNDTHGEEIGDALLTAIAERLRGLVLAPATLARVGGDEFAILLPEAAGAAQSPALATHLVEDLGVPLRVAGLELPISASVGVARAPVDATDGTALLKAATLALAKAKALGGATTIAYDRSLEAAQSDRRALQLDLRSAMARGELELEYQPIVELSSGRIVACEALARWNHPQRGRVSPAVFIEIAEQIGLIAALGAWVVRTAVREAASWPAGIAVTVNVSPLQFRSKLLAQAVEAALGSSGLAAARLILEVTESTLLGADTETVAALAALRTRGVGLALDDFGTGYASLAYLDRFRFDVLKVDRSFLANSHLPATGAILEAVARLGGDLGMRTVAEGVETEAQRARLVELGYDCAQGFLFARPMPAGAIASLLMPGDAPLGAATGDAPLGVATEGAPLGVATEGAPLGVATEGAPLGVATEGAPLGATPAAV